MKTTDDKTEIVLAQWQTCVEMANSVSQRRDTMNNIFVTLNLAIVAAISINWDVKSLFILVAGIVVSVIWLLFIRNYKLLNTEKFNVINDIEKNYRLSHSWAYGDAYDKLTNMLRSKPYFDYRDYSVPKNDPIHNASYAYQLKEAIRRQMQPASCVLIMAGVYSTYSKWINIEIELAKSMNKKIIAIELWGSERTSAVVKNAADKIVRWNTDSIVSAIRGY